MGAKTVTTWTCDRCGGTWETKGDHSKQPPSPWGSVRFHVPPKHADASAQWVICPECESSFSEWMYPDRSVLTETFQVHIDHLADLTAWNSVGRDPADAIDVFLRLAWPSENAPWMTRGRDAHRYLPRWMAEALDITHPEHAGRRSSMPLAFVAIGNGPAAGLRRLALSGRHEGVLVREAS